MYLYVLNKLRIRYALLKLEVILNTCINRQKYIFLVKRIRKLL